MLWIRIRSDLALLDPNPDPNPDPDPGARKLTKIYKNLIFTCICTYEARIYVLLPTVISGIFFHVKFLFLVTAKSDQDPDPHGSSLIWLDPH